MYPIITQKDKRFRLFNEPTGENHTLGWYIHQVWINFLGSIIGWGCVYFLYRDLSSSGLSVNSITLTQLFYDIINHMNITKKIFLLMSLICVFYVYWFIAFFMRMLTALPPPPHHLFMHWLNVFTQISLLIYLVFEWKHFIHWNRKMRTLEKLEQMIYQELESGK